MDPTRRNITKIASQAERLVIRMMRNNELGAAEVDMITYIRKHPGLSQKEVCQELGMDKGGCARRTANLETKGYLVREKNPEDGRGQLLYPTEKCDAVKHTRAHIEAEFYQWLMADLSEEELTALSSTLKKLNEKAAAEAEAGFPHVIPNI